MRNRITFGITIFGAISALLFIKEMYTYLMVYWDWCQSVSDDRCITEKTPFFIFSWIIFCVSFIVIIEVIFLLRKNYKKKHCFEVKEYDSTPYSSSIAVVNKIYPVVENCSVELIQVNILNNRACKVFFDENRNVGKVPMLFLWDNESENKNLSKDGFGKIKIALVTKDEKIVLLTKKPMDYLWVFPDRKHGKSAKKVKYQIKIKTSGKVNNDGVENIVENFSYWEIGYCTDGQHFNNQNIWIKRIYELTEVNDFDLAKPVPQVVSMKIVIEK